MNSISIVANTIKTQGLGTIYTNKDSRCIYEPNPSLFNEYWSKETVSIFKDYKNNLGYQGEAVLLEKVDMKQEDLLFTSDIDILIGMNVKSTLSLLNKNESADAKSVDNLRNMIKDLKHKSNYFNRLIDENDDDYSAVVCKLINKLKTHYRSVKSKTNNTKELFKLMIKKLNSIKKQETSKRKTRSDSLISFFQEFTDLQIVFNVIRSVTVDFSAPLYYLEKWRVMFIPQEHYTLASFNSNKLNNIAQVKDKNVVSKYNNKNKRLILYNTPFVTTRYIRKVYDKNTQ